MGKLFRGGMVGFDLFMAVVAIVLAAFLTWLILWWYLAPTHRDSSALANAANAIRVARSTQTSNVRATHADPRALIIAAILTVLVVLMNLARTINPATARSWTGNPWLQVILITPAILYCGMPIAIEGWESLKHHTPDTNTLTTLGSAAAYIYSLLLCVAARLLPEDSNGPYFDIAGMAITLALLGRLLEMRVTARNKSGSDLRSPMPNVSDAGRAPASVRRYYHLALWCVPVAMVAASWSFALCIVFGYQPRLPHAIVAAFSVLIVVGLGLAAIKTIVAWRLLRDESVTSSSVQPPSLLGGGGRSGGGGR